MLRLRLFLYFNALTYDYKERRTAMGLRLLTKVSRLRIGTLRWKRWETASSPDGWLIGLGFGFEKGGLLLPGSVYFVILISHNSCLSLT